MSILLEAERLTLGRDSNGVQMTPAEFDAVTDWDDNYRYELIQGVVIVSPIPLEAEADPNEELGHLLRQYRDTDPQGTALNLTLPERYIHVPNGRRRADRVIWAGLGRRPDPKEDVPTIAVEFVSVRQRDRRRDFVAKRTEYRAVGVKEYWIIDRFRQEMTVCFQDGNQRVIPQDQTYETPLLPGFVLPLARILALAAAWADRAEDDDDANSP
jgi:Uma2 family endonuclease